MQLISWPWFLKINQWIINISIQYVCNTKWVNIKNICKNNAGHLDMSWSIDA